jgi:hypothetical protein
MRPRTALHVSALLAALSTTSSPATAQESIKPRGGTPAQAVTAAGGLTAEAQLRARAQDLAASTAEEALKWEDKAAAARVISQAADLLWDEYPDRCRAWLASAWELTAAVSAADADEAVRRFRSTSPRSGARTAVLSVAQKHDRPFADALLARLADEKDRDAESARQGVFDDRTARSEQLLNLALAYAEKDPATSAELAEKSLVDGISFQLQALLLALRGRDEAAAGRVFDSALRRLSTSFTHPSEGQVLASYLFTPGRVLSPGGVRKMLMAVGTQVDAPRRVPADDDPARTRRFLTVMQGVLLSSPEPGATADPARTAQEYAALSGSLANAYIHYAPELWPPIERHTALLTMGLTKGGADTHLPSPVAEKMAAAAPGEKDEKEVERLYQEGLEEQAERESDPTARRLAYVRAALATKPEDLDRGRRLAGKIDEADLRGRLVSFLVYRTALARLQEGGIDDAVRLAAEAAPLPRAIICITAAQRLAGARQGEGTARGGKKKLSALELLSTAEDILSQDGLPDEARRVRLGLVASLAPLDPGRALEAFRRAVAAINEGAPFNFSDTSAPRIADLAGASDSLLPRISTGYGLKDAVAPLSRADFENTVAAAAGLKEPAARGTCMLEIARSILSNGKEK